MHICEIGVPHLRTPPLKGFVAQMVAPLHADRFVHAYNAVAKGMKTARISAEGWRDATAVEPAKDHASPRSGMVLYGTHLLRIIKLCNNADGFLVTDNFPYPISSQY